MNAFLVKCKCRHCDQPLEFEAAQAGQTVNCPNCGMETLLFIPPKPGGRRMEAVEFNTKYVIIILGLVFIFSLLVSLGAAAEPDHEVNPIILFLLSLCMGILYFAPALIATRKRQFPALLALNLLLGWTVIGWAGALVWAMLKEKHEE